MRQCFRCNQTFADDLPFCPACGFARSFSVAGTSRIVAAGQPKPMTAPAGLAGTAGAVLMDQDPDAEWTPSGIRWGGITMIGVLFPLLVIIHLSNPESIFLLLMQWITVGLACALLFEQTWAIWLAVTFGVFTALGEVRSSIVAAAMGNWLAVIFGSLVAVGLILAVVMIKQGYSHPGTRKLVWPSMGLVAFNLFLVLGGAAAAHVSGEAEGIDRMQSTDTGRQDRTERTYQQMQEVLDQQRPAARPEQDE